MTPFNFIDKSIHKWPWSYPVLGLLTALMMALSSCSLGRRVYPIDIPCRALEEATEQAAKDPLFKYTECLPNDWWHLFRDPQLDWLIETTLAQNPTIEMAHWKIKKAKLQADEARGNLLPNLSAGADATKFVLSETGIIPFNNPTSGTFQLVNAPNFIPQNFMQYEMELNFNWDLDLWGKNRSILASACGEVQASLADEAFTRIALSMSVAQAYYRLQMDYARLNINREIVTARQQYVDLVQHLVNADLNSAIDLHGAQSNLDIAKRSLLAIEGDIAVSEHQLQAFLAGDFDESFSDINLAQKPLPAVPLPSEIHLNLIAHRPDIISQLWLVESAARIIQAAKAGFYPDINLLAIAGLQTIHIDQFFLSKSGYGEGQVATSLPLYSGGRQQAQLKGVAVDYNQAVLQYNNLIVNATKEVLDAISVVRNANDQLDTYKQQAAHLKEIMELMRLRSQHHLASDLDTLVSQEQSLLASDAEIVAKANRINATLALIKALGAGYESCLFEPDEDITNKCFPTNPYLEKYL